MTIPKDKVQLAMWCCSEGLFLFIQLEVDAVVLSALVSPVTSLRLHLTHVAEAVI